MRYVTIFAKDVAIIPDFLTQLENNTNSKVIKQYINNVIKKHFVYDNRQRIEDFSNIFSTEALNSLEANKLKHIISNVLIKKNTVSEHKFLRGKNNALSYKMFPSNIFENVKTEIVSLAKRDLKKYLKDSSIKLNKTFIEKMNKTLYKDKVLRSLVKDEYTQDELYSIFILYQFKTLNVTELDTDMVFTYNFSDTEKDKLSHIIDYLNSLREIPENTVDRTEAYKQKDAELKLKLKNLSFTDLEKEVNNWKLTDDTIVQKTLHKEIKDGDVELIHKYQDGYSWVSIISETGLDREGSNMNHCVGGDSYWKKVKNGDSLIYSLRNKYNKPCITIESTFNTLVQIQGYGNSTVSDKYNDYLLDGLRNYIKFDKSKKCSYLERNGILLNNQELYSVYNLPDKFECTNKISFNSDRKFTIKNLTCKELEIISAPNMAISGHIVCEKLIMNDDTVFSQLRPVFNKIDFAYGQIGFYSVDVTHPDDFDYLEKCIPLKIKMFLEKHNIEVYECIVKSISKDIKSYNKDLHLWKSSIKSLPKGFTVKGDLGMQFSSIEKLPEDLLVEGNLDLEFSKVKELSKGTRIGAYLDLSNTKIKELPSDLKVGTDIDLRYTDIKELPQNLHVEGNLDLSHSKIEKLPKGLKVNGSLKLEGTKIKELPDNLVVGYTLDLTKTLIEKLPDGLSIFGDLILADTKINKLPKRLHIERNLVLYHNDKIKELPSDIKINGTIYTNNHAIKKIPSSIKVRYYDG